MASTLEKSKITSGNSDAPVPTLETLPPEIKLKILSYLPPRALCESVMPVNSDWLARASHPSLWRCVNIFVPESNGIDRVIQFLRRIPGVRRISLRSDEVSSLWYMAARISVMRQDGRLSDVLTGGMFENAAVSLRDVLHQCKKLKSLSLNCFHLRDLPALLVPGLTPELRELHLIRCLGATPEVLAAITSKCPQLELLEIDVTHCIPVGIFWIAVHLKHLRALFVNHPREKSLQYLASKGPKLEAVGLQIPYFLEDNSQGQPELCTISESTLLTYFGMPTMKFVQVFQDCIQSAPAENFSIPKCLSVASKNGTLRGVEFSIGGLLDDSVADDVNFQCLSLEWLSLEFLARISDGGVTALLRACPNLKVLRVINAWKPLTGVPWLPSIGDTCPKLKILALSTAALVPDASDETLMEVLKTAAVNNPKVAMVWNGNVVPPNDARYSAKSVDLFQQDSRVCSLDALDKYGVPFEGCFNPDF